MNIDPFDQQLDKPRLLRGKKLLPQFFELRQSRSDFLLRYLAAELPGRAPGLYDDLGRADEVANLIEDDALDFGGGDQPHRAVETAATLLQRRLADIIA